MDNDRIKEWGELIKDGVSSIVEKGALEKDVPPLFTLQFIFLTVGSTYLDMAGQEKFNEDLREIKRVASEMKSKFSNRADG